MDYRKWIWIELIGFDCTLEDCGVEEYLERLGFVPEVISLLIFSPDFFHHHTDTTYEETFPPDYCSYNAHPFNAERDRQSWTNHNLLTLVKELHARGVKVLPAVFSFYLDNEFHPEWLRKHGELLELWRDGSRVPAINPLKRMADGTLYEDFFFTKMAEVVDYYGFDGWHAADGWAHPRTPIWRSDFSDDMVGQFLQHSGISLPASISLQADSDPEAITQRADYIYQNHRLAWAEFHSDRWASFHRKAADILHKKGLLLAANAAWTRDPFEAFYRYGVDYSKLHRAGVDVLITESAAAAADMEAGGGDRHHNFVTTMLLTGTNTPDMPLIYLNGLKDVMEQWDVLRHVPAVLEKEIYALSNVYKFDGAQYTRCAHGPLACLGDGIQSLEWRRLHAMWDLAFSGDPIDTSGPLLIWDDDHIRRHVDEFAANGTWSIHKLTFELSKRGAWVTSACRVQDLPKTDRPILLINPHEMQPENIQAVLSNAAGPLIAIGPDLSMLEGAEISISDICGPRPLSCKVCRPGCKCAPEPLKIECNTHWNPSTQEPTNFLHELNFAPVSEAFLSGCADIIKAVCKFPVLTMGEDDISARWLKMPDGAYRVALSNNSFHYVRAEVQMPFEIEHLHVSGPFPVARLVTDGSNFQIKVPGKGLTLVDVYSKG